MWQTLRPAGDQPEGATQAYFFVFFGEASLQDWDLEALFTDAYGPEEGVAACMN